MCIARLHDRWHYTRGEEKLTVQVKGRVQCDDSDAVRRLALMGEGVACKSELHIAEELIRNTLVRLRED